MAGIIASEYPELEVLLASNHNELILCGPAWVGVRFSGLDFSAATRKQLSHWLPRLFSLAGEASDPYPLLVEVTFVKVHGDRTITPHAQAMLRALFAAFLMERNMSPEGVKYWNDIFEELGSVAGAYMVGKFRSSSVLEAAQDPPNSSNYTETVFPPPSNLDADTTKLICSKMHALVANAAFEYTWQHDAVLLNANGWSNVEQLQLHLWARAVHEGKCSDKLWGTLKPLYTDENWRKTMQAVAQMHHINFSSRPTFKGELTNEVLIGLLERCALFAVAAETQSGASETRAVTIRQLAQIVKDHHQAMIRTSKVIRAVLETSLEGPGRYNPFENRSVPAGASGPRAKEVELVYASIMKKAKTDGEELLKREVNDVSVVTADVRLPEAFEGLNVG